jgi:sulfite dehydrogenase (cytochrome) subunit B
MRIMRIVFAAAAMLAAAFAAAAPGHAEEQPVQLKKAPGIEAVETNCGACHSLDYIRMNSPFMTPQVWEAEVAKMIKAYGAPIEDKDARTIVEYLTANYGGPATATTPSAATQGR